MILIHGVQTNKQTKNTTQQKTPTKQPKKPPTTKNKPKSTNCAAFHPSPYINSNFGISNPSITPVNAKFLICNLISIITYA